MMRRVTSTFGIFFARDVLHLRKGSFGSKYVQLFVGFFVSATIHAGSSMLCYRDFRDNSEYFFFLSQAVVIMIEDHVMHFGRYLGLRDSLLWRMVGYSWTVVWFGMSMRVYSLAAIRAGIWYHRPTVDIFGIGPAKA